MHFSTTVDDMVFTAKKDAERSERSVTKLRDAENLLKEAVDLYKAANDVGRQRAAESNLVKVGWQLHSTSQGLGPCSIGHFCCD